MPPSNIVKSLAGVIECMPDLADDLLTNVDQPLRVVKDPSTGKDYVICDYNRDGDAYRSPWSNTYFNPEDGAETDGFSLSPELRTLEQEANIIFDAYREQYFSTGLSSVYFFDCDEPTFGAAFLIHKEVPAVDTLKKGVWDSSHIFDVTPVGTDEYQYTLTSTVLIAMNLNESSTGDVDLSGSMTMQTTKTKSLDKFNGHLVHMGTMIEEAEGQLRNRIESIYIQKTREVLSGARNSSGARDAAWADIATNLKNSFGARK
jgi:capping protein beta